MWFKIKTFEWKNMTELWIIGIIIGMTELFATAELMYLIQIRIWKITWKDLNLQKKSQ